MRIPDNAMQAIQRDALELGITDQSGKVVASSTNFTWTTLSFFADQQPGSTTSLGF